MVSKLLQEWLQEDNRKRSIRREALSVHRCVEPQKDGGPVQITSIMRHYLSITHLLAVEVLRYLDYAYAPVPRSERLCTMCKKEVETPEHALISCDALDPLAR
jgi:hypothetical protein